MTTTNLKPMQHYNAQGELVTSYARFVHGDRVKADLGHTGTVEAVIAAGGTFRKDKTMTRVSISELQLAASKHGWKRTQDVITGGLVIYRYFDDHGERAKMMKFGTGGVDGIDCYMDPEFAA